MVKKEQKPEHIDECRHAQLNGHGTRSIAKAKSPSTSKTSSSGKQSPGRTAAQLIRQQQDLRDAKHGVTREYLMKYIKDNDP